MFGLALRVPRDRTVHRVSDFDLAIQAEGSALGPLARARQELEESTIPFQVDLVDLAEASDALAEEVRRKGVLVWRN